MFTIGSLFAGIGGFDLGLERAGFSVRWQCECEPFALRVLEKHWPHVTRYTDIRRLGVDNAPERVDLLCGGFPCQPHSLAGKRGGSTDERDLWSEFARTIRLLRPRWVLAENVSGLLSTESGRFFDRVLRDLAESGFDAEWDVLPGRAVGAPHGRERLWLIAYPLGTRGPRLVTSAHPYPHGPWGWRGAEDLQSVADAPFERGDRWPQPMFRRVDDGLSRKVDRLHGIGNAILPQIAQWIGEQIIASA